MSEDRAPEGQGTSLTIALAQAQERLRQERAAFDQHYQQKQVAFELRKQQAMKWFPVQIAMAWAAVVLLPAIMFVCSWIIFNSRQFDTVTVAMATSGLLVDALGLFISIWRIVITVRGRVELADAQPISPVTAAVHMGNHDDSSGKTGQ